MFHHPVLVAIFLVVAGVCGARGSDQAVTSNPALEELLGGRHYSYREIVALFSDPAGTPSLPAMLRALRHDDATVRALAAFRLGDTEKPDAEIVSGLIRSLEDRDLTVAMHAGASLERIGRNHPGLLTPHIEDFKRIRTLESVLEWTEQKSDDDLTIADAVITALDGSRSLDLSELVASYRKAAARRPSPRSPAAQASNADAFDRANDVGSSRYFLTALRRHLESARSLNVKVVEGLLSDSDIELRRLGLEFVQKSGEVSEGLILALLSAIASEPSAEDRFRAATALKNVGAAERLKGMLTHRDAISRAAAYQALTTTVTCDDAHFSDWIRNSDPAVRAQALNTALANFAGSNHGCLEPLLTDPLLDVDDRGRLLRHIVDAEAGNVEAQISKHLSLLGTIGEPALIKILWESLRSISVETRVDRQDLLKLARAGLLSGDSTLRAEIVCAFGIIKETLWRDDAALVVPLIQTYGELPRSQLGSSCQIDSIIKSFGKRLLGSDKVKAALLEAIRMKRVLTDADLQLVLSIVPRHVLSLHLEFFFDNKSALEQLRNALWLEQQGFRIQRIRSPANTDSAKHNLPWRFDVEGDTPAKSARRLAFLQRAITGPGFAPELRLAALRRVGDLPPATARKMVSSVLAASRSSDATSRATAVGVMQKVLEDGNLELVRFVEDPDPDVRD